MTRTRIAVWLFVLLSAALPGGSGHGQSAQPNSGSYDSELSVARRLTREKQFRQAIDAADRAIKLDSNRWEAYAAAAEAYLGEGLPDDAIGMLQLALARAPHDKKPPIRELIDEVRLRSSRPTAAAAPSAPAAAAPPTAPDVIARGIATLGGAEAIANVRTLILMYTLSGKSGTSEFRQYIRLPDAERTELSDDGQGGMVFVHNNGSAWSKFSSDPAEATKYSAPVVWWDGLLNLANGTQKVDAVSVAGDEMLLRTGDNDLILDISTGLIRRMVTRWTYQGVPYSSETTLSDYRRVDAVLWPFVWRSTTTSPTGNATTVYTHVEINRPLSATLFDRLR
jgi:hypothetical protein